MKKLIYVILICFALFSCKQEYTYVEIGNGQSKETVIKHENDSVAYLEAYKTFCTSLAAEAMTRKASPDYSAISAFQLFDKSGKFVKAPFTAASKIQHEKDIEDRVFGALGKDDVAIDKLYKFKTLELQLNF